MELGTLREYSPNDDVWVMALVLGCFLVLMLLLGHQRKYIGELAQNFFLPTNRQEKTVQRTTGERYLPIISSFVMICATGLMLFTYVHQVYDLQQSPYSTLLVLGVCIGVFVGYYLLRYLLYSFVNWVFFERSERKLWMSGFVLLSIMETTLAYVLMCAAMFFHLKLQEVGISIAICYGILRFLCIAYTKRIFFPEFYGFLHLIAYLCTLEIVPLLAIWKICEVCGGFLVSR